jgi:YVTN family beta-propeller protein
MLHKTVIDRVITTHRIREIFPTECTQSGWNNQMSERSMKMRATFRPLAGLLALGLAAPAMAAPSTPYPTYPVGPQADGSIVMSTNQTITPAGKLVDLGTATRAKAVAVNPNKATNTAAVLEMGAAQAVQVFDLVTGQVVQSYSPANDKSGSFGGIAYSADGKYLFFSQDSSHLAIAKVDSASGQLSDYAHIALPPDTSIPLYTSSTAYPGGVAVSEDGKAAYVLLNQNNTLGVIDLTKPTPVLTEQIRVGNVPNSVVLKGGFAYVSNEGGRIAKKTDFTDTSSGTPIVSDPHTDSASTGTVSVVNLTTHQVVDTIHVGLHPTGMTVSGSLLYVANAYGESVSVIDLTTNQVIRTIPVKIPVKGAFGSMPTSIVIDGSVMFVSLFTANAVAVVDLSGGELADPVIGYIPTASSPSTIAFDTVRKQLVVSDDKGIGTQGQTASSYSVTGFNSHPSSGRVSLIKVPSLTQLSTFTTKVFQNNHWDLTQNTQVGPKYVDPNAAPVAIPAHIGEPSLIKHVFLIIKENRTYDQILGDVKKGNGDASLAVFGAVTPNQHAFVERFPLLDNVYAPSRQSADGHPWIVSGISAYADEIQSPDWVRSYPGGNSNDEMVYTPRGFLWDAAATQGLTVRMFGEWSGKQAITGNYSWSDWYNYAQILEGKKKGRSPINPYTDTETSTVPSVTAILDPHYPSFNTGIPDQYRVDYWLPIFKDYESSGTLPALTIIWLPDDHTSGFSTGFPIPTAAQADNDLALGRIVDAISHSKDWMTSAIFVEEDDAQDGVDHVDGHRQPVYVISPYAVQNKGTADHTTYTAASIDRTIEQILGLTPMTQFDLVASPMRTAFTDKPNKAPFNHRAPTIDPATFPTSTAANAVQKAWNLASDAVMNGKTDKADSVDENFLNRAIWYGSTGFTRPYPGESTVKLPAEFQLKATDDKDIDD